MTSRTIETAHNVLDHQERFWLVSTLVGETIHPGELGSFDKNDPAGSIRRAREAAARRLGVGPEDIVPGSSLHS